MKSFLKTVLWIFAIVALSAGVACVVSDYLNEKRSVEVDIAE